MKLGSQVTNASHAQQRALRACVACKFPPEMPIKNSPSIRRAFCVWRVQNPRTKHNSGSPLGGQMIHWINCLSASPRQAYNPKGPKDGSNQPCANARAFVARQAKPLACRPAKPDHSSPPPATKLSGFAGCVLRKQFAKGKCCANGSCLVYCPAIASGLPNYFGNSFS